MTKKADINTQEAISLYQNGAGAQTIARLYGSSKATILNTLRENGVIIRGAHDTHGTHRMKGTRLYRIWHGMKGRCLYDHPICKRYKGRGITVCDDWMNSFEEFRDWAFSNGYDEALSLDRKDNDGNYEPSNCRWSTQKEQANNTSKNHLVTIYGKTQTVTQWAEAIGCKPKTVFARIHRGATPEEALSLGRMVRT